MHPLSSVLMSVTGVSARHPVNTVKPADMAAPEAVRLVHRQSREALPLGPGFSLGTSPLNTIPLPPTVHNHTH